MVLSSAAEFQQFMCDAAVFVKHKVLEEPEHDLFFALDSHSTSLSFLFGFPSSTELVRIKFYMAVR